MWHPLLVWLLRSTLWLPSGHLTPNMAGQWITGYKSSLVRTSLWWNCPLSTCKSHTTRMPTKLVIILVTFIMDYFYRCLFYHLHTHTYTYTHLGAQSARKQYTHTRLFIAFGSEASIKNTAFLCFLSLLPVSVGVPSSMWLPNFTILTCCLIMAHLARETRGPNWWFGDIIDEPVRCARRCRPRNVCVCVCTCAIVPRRLCMP